MQADFYTTQYTMPEVVGLFVCERAHLSKRSIRGLCLECRVERRREYAKQFYRNNATARNAKIRAAYADDAVRKKKQSARMKEYRASNPVLVKEQSQKAYRKRLGKHAEKRRRKAEDGSIRAYMLEYNYGITKEQHDQMFLIQDGKCAICREADKLVVDHCHSSNKVRGLLCHHCNKGLGFFKDAPERMSAAIEYLKAKS